MVFPQASLNLRIPWEAVCTALGLPIHTRALPLRTRCPLCNRDALNLYNDTIFGGQWHHCNACGSSGDLIELACTAWQVPPAVALRRLSEAGVPISDQDMTVESVDRYSHDHQGQRKRMNLLWETARKQFPAAGGGHVQGIRRRYNLKLDIGPERWAAGPGRLIGATTRLCVERTFHPAMLATGELFNTSGKRVFKGSKWSDVITVPFYDLPDRIHAFVFLGRDGIVPQDQIFRRAAARKTDCEAGLAHLETIEMAGDPGMVIATDDWLLALQIQFRNFRTSMKTLPLIIWHDDGQSRTRGAWAMLSNRKIVFWPLRMDARVIRQVMEIDGLISTCGPAEPDRHSVGHYLRQRPGQDLVNVVTRYAKPWPKALRSWMDSATDGQAADLLLRLEESGTDVSYILRQLGNKVQAEVPRPIRTVQFGPVTIVEQQDSWHIANKRGRIEVLNAVMRLTHAIRDRSSGEIFYRGEIRHKGKVIPFIERAAVIRDRTAQWLGAKMADRGVGVLSFSHGYSKRLHQISILFQEPQLVQDDLWRWVDKLREEESES